MSISFWTIDDYVNAYRNNQTTPTLVAKAFFAAVTKSDEDQPPLRSIIKFNASAILAQAQKSTKRWKSGAQLSVLDGVPIAVKDEFAVKDYTHTFGTNGKFVGLQQETTDDTIIARLRSMGALIVGIANMHEYGVLPLGYNQHHGSSRNPYDPRRISGGSSSGSAAAVSSGLVPVAIGADGTQLLCCSSLLP